MRSPLHGFSRRLRRKLQVLLVTVLAANLLALSLLALLPVLCFVGFSILVAGILALSFGLGRFGALVGGLMPGNDGSRYFAASVPAFTDAARKTREFHWDGSENLSFDMLGVVHYQPAAQWKLIVRASPWILDRLKIAAGHIGLADRLSHPGKIEVELRGPRLQSVALNGVGRIVLDQIEQDDLSIDLRGTGEVGARGKVTRLALNLMGCGNMNLAKLTAATLQVRIFGSGNAHVAPTGTADILIAGSGNVILHAKPKHLNSKVIGSGRTIDATTADSGSSAEVP
jgi:hypothetical protein